MEFLLWPLKAVVALYVYGFGSFEQYMTLGLLVGAVWTTYRVRKTAKPLHPNDRPEFVADFICSTVLWFFFLPLELAMGLFTGIDWLKRNTPKLWRAAN